MPWVNGLIENLNKILIGWLKRMCAPDIEDAEANNPNPGATPTQWTSHLDEVVRAMNDRIIPALGFMPCKLLWGQWESTTEKPAADREADSQDTLHHFAFTDLLHSQGYVDALAEATCRKTQFDSKVHPMDFQVGDYIQVYNSRLDATYKAKAKLLPRWSPPRIITGRLLNSYTLCRPDGTEFNGTFHT